MAEWKHQVLRVLPPYIALKPFREIVIHLWLHLSAAKKEEFTIAELEEDFRNTVEKTSNPIVKKEYERCLGVLPDLLKALVTAELLIVNQKGVYRKSESFTEFWYFISHVLSVEKLVKWGIYYLTKQGKTFFTSENLVEVIALGDTKDIEKDLSDLVIFEDGEWKKVLEKRNERWIIKKTYPYTPPSLLKPFLISDFHNKLLFSIQVLSQSGTEFVTEDVVKLIQLKEQEEVERVLRKLGFKKHRNEWLTGHKNVDVFIKDLESPLRLPRGWIEINCLNLLDRGSYSWTELVEITKADPSTLSRSLNRLKKAKVIVPKGEGKWGRRYYITNCDNCPFLTDKETCKSALISEIESMMREMKMPKPTVDLKHFSNQVLKRFIDLISEIKMDRTEKTDVQEFRQLIDLMFDSSLISLIEDQKKAKDIYEKHGTVKSVTELMEREYPMPYLYSSAAKKAIRLLTQEKT
jgi:DNA-binding transcriptional ArsR family regulator